MRKGLSGWLSPEGNFLPVSYGKHDEVVRILEEANFIEDIHNEGSNLNYEHGERLLELLGYIKFVCSGN